MKVNFPGDFVWGAASSAYQIEGYATADGGGESIWDEFCRQAGKVAYGDNGSVACDSYHRYMEDVELLDKLGVKAYRFSTSWARIDPKGDGNFNEAGIAYYERLCDALLERGITPYMTLYHWELPQALEEKGGWLLVETVKAFERFAAMMAKRFKGRVKHYFTLNEPQCTVSLGYTQGIHAPGKELGLEEQFICWKHQLMAHGLAQRAILAADSEAEVGLVSTGRLCYPEKECTEDIAAAREMSFAVVEDDWQFTHHMLFDPAVLGRFPDCTGTSLEPFVKAVTAEEMEIIHCPPHVIGLNVYNGHQVRATDKGGEYAPKYPGFPRTALKWPITPEVLDWGVRFICERYGLPCYVAENGLSCNDIVYLDGKVHDADRIDFLSRYIGALSRASEAGADVRGYFHWSILDNFEWHSGYAERFGLVYVDYRTLERIPKDSYYWYKKLIETGEM